MVRIAMILILLAAAGHTDSGAPTVPPEPKVEEVLADPEWIAFLENLEMLEEYGDLLDMESPEPIPAKPDDPRGVNTGGDGSDSKTK